MVNGSRRKSWRVELGEPEQAPAERPLSG